MQKEIIFLGSKPIGYHCLAHLLQQQTALGYTVKGILTNDNPVFSKDLSLTQLAAEHNIPVIASPDEIPACDILYSVQYHLILQQQHISRARQRAVNLHMAPLPEYRGCNQFSFAILDGAATFGTTVHTMDARIDHGDILFENRFSIPENCWVNELYQLTYEASLQLFTSSLPAIINDEVHPVPQQDLLGIRTSSLHYRHEINQVKQIDLNWPEEKIQRHIRATYMPGFEPPYTLLNGTKVYFEPQPAS
jgi:methionyl-tRNA formyltransferase